MIKIADSLAEKINSIPELPGIYKMIDSHGNIIYIGKSKCLKKRVKSYFAATPAWEKVKKMVGFIQDIEFTVTDTHLEARLLECELIKAVKPVFNAQLKRDKSYVFLKLEDYNIHNPLSVVHERTGQAYGPLRSRYRLEDLAAAMKNIYPIRRNGDHYGFEYHMMPVPLDRTVFQKNRDILAEVLSEDGKITVFIEDLDSKMKEAASEFKFETASRFRDLMTGMTMLKHGINGYRNLAAKNIVLNIPVGNGNKLFFVSQGFIRLKQFFPVLSDKHIKQFIEKGKKLSGKALKGMNEKEAIDFRDILYSEILSLPEEMIIILE